MGHPETIKPEQMQEVAAAFYRDLVDRGYQPKDVIKVANAVLDEIVQSWRQD